MHLEEEVINLQKDLVVYLLFSYDLHQAERSGLPFYFSEFGALISESGGYSPVGRAYLETFFNNAAILLENPIVYNAESVRSELVKALSSPQFTHAVLCTDERFSPAERDKAAEYLNETIRRCMEKSKNPEDLIRILAEKARKEREDQGGS